MAALPTADAYEWFTETSRSRASARQNEVTLRSLEMLSEYEPATYVSRVSPTPLLLVVARDDHVTPPDLALAAYEQALEPKRLVLLAGGHFDAYTGAGFAQASSAERDFLVEHLAAAASSS